MGIGIVGEGRDGDRIGWDRWKDQQIGRDEMRDKITR